VNCDLNWSVGLLRSCRRRLRRNLETIHSLVELQRLLLRCFLHNQRKGKFLPRTESHAARKSPMVLIALGNCWGGRLSVRLNQTQRARMLRTRRSCTRRRQFLKLESRTPIAIGGGGATRRKSRLGRPKMIAVVRHELVAERIEASRDSVPPKICGGL